MKPFLIAALLTVPALVAAQPLAAQPMEGHGAFQQVLVRKLNLTQAQRASIQQVLEAHRADLSSARQAVAQARAALAQALVDPATTPAQVQTLSAALASAQVAAALQVNQVVQQVAPLLSTAQVSAAKNLVAEYIAKVRDFRAWFMTPGPDAAQSQN
jgi:hypothetical protein